MAKAKNQPAENKTKYVGKGLQTAREAIIAKRGAESVTTFNQIVHIPRMSTSSLLFDDMLGGGLPLGRIVHLFGREMGGKSAIAQWICGIAQDRGLEVAYLDPEHGLDPAYVKRTFNFDVRKDNVLISQENDAATLWDMVETLAICGIPIIVLDSMDSTMTQAEASGEIGNKHIAQLASIHSDALKKINAVMLKSGSIFIPISQVRIAGIGSGTGGYESFSGGNAIRHYASIRIKVSKAKDPIIGTGGRAIGQDIICEAKKNKTSPPFRKCDSLKLIYNEGINADHEVFTLGKDYGIIEQKGAWFYLGEKRTQGGAEMIEHLANNPELAKEVRSKVIIEMQKIYAGDIDAPDATKDDVAEPTAKIETEPLKTKTDPEKKPKTTNDKKEEIAENTPKRRKPKS